MSRTNVHINTDTENNNHNNKNLSPNYNINGNNTGNAGNPSHNGTDIVGGGGGAIATGSSSTFTGGSGDDDYDYEHDIYRQSKFCCFIYVLVTVSSIILIKKYINIGDIIWIRNYKEFNTLAPYRPTRFESTKIDVQEWEYSLKYIPENERLITNIVILFFSTVMPWSVAIVCWIIEYTCYYKLRKFSSWFIDDLISFTKGYCLCLLFNFVLISFLSLRIALPKPTFYDICNFSILNDKSCSKNDNETLFKGLTRFPNIGTCLVVSIGLYISLFICNKMLFTINHKFFSDYYPIIGNNMNDPDNDNHNNNGGKTKDEQTMEAIMNMGCSQHQQQEKTFSSRQQSKSQSPSLVLENDSENATLTNINGISMKQQKQTSSSDGKRNTGTISPSIKIVESTSPRTVTATVSPTSPRINSLVGGVNSSSNNNTDNNNNDNNDNNNSVTVTSGTGTGGDKRVNNEVNNIVNNVSSSKKNSDHDENGTTQTNKNNSEDKKNNVKYSKYNKKNSKKIQNNTNNKNKRQNKNKNTKNANAIAMGIKGKGDKIKARMDSCLDEKSMSDNSNEEDVIIGDFGKHWGLSIRGVILMTFGLIPFYISIFMSVCIVYDNISTPSDMLGSCIVSFIFTCYIYGYFWDYPFSCLAFDYPVCIVGVPKKCRYYVRQIYHYHHHPWLQCPIKQ